MAMCYLVASINLIKGKKSDLAFYFFMWLNLLFVSL